MAQRDLDGAVSLRTGIYSKVEILGMEFSLKIDGATIIFRLPVSGSGRSLAMRGSHGDIAHEAWGFVNSTETVTIHQLGYRVDADEDDVAENVSQYSTEIADAVRNLWWWMAIVARETPDLITGHQPIKWAEYDLQRDAGLNAVPVAIWTQAKHTRRSWKHAFEHVVVGDPLPTSTRLLLGAQENVARGEIRPAILDAATALEVALNWSIREVINRSDPSGKLADTVLHRRTLGALKGIAEQLGVPISKDMQDKLVRPRNQIMHEGAELTHGQAEDAIAAALVGVDLLRTELGAGCKKCTSVRKSLTEP